MEILKENLKSTFMILGLTCEQLKYGLPYSFIIIIIIIIFITLNKLCYDVCFVFDVPRTAYGDGATA